ncbi:MAG: DUF1549 and DUF1553 domain-containing protein [Gemmataceae bacterium]|nr:DUF1549 and DUF1553 domain-containing protein [Gemmataceae bacterium]
MTHRLSLGLIATLALTSPLFAQAPLHERIDQAIAAGKPNFESVAAPLASDAEFLRRVTLDLTGTIPTATEVRAFLADNAADKRAKLIDRLLASAEYPRHMANVFDVLLMERRAGKHVPNALWHEYLRASFAGSKPWDQLVREIVSADGIDPAQRPAAKFYLDRNAEPHLLTKDISRLFLGMNLQCAQCHDHPRVKHYAQDYYYGIYAFLNRSFLFTDAKAKLTVLAEKADGDVTYVSVFDPAKVTKSTGPRMPRGPVVKEPELVKGAEYVVAPAKDVRPVPKYSRRAQLADQLTAADNVQFRRNIANRLWAHMMGRGLVHPIDFDHPANPPSHPELMSSLADEIAAMKYDTRAFLRELALSKTYQRSSELPASMKEPAPDSFMVANLKPLSAEQLAWALMQATGMTDSERLTQGAKLTETSLYTKLAPSAGSVIGIFAGPAGQAENFQATLDQALFVANGKILRAWLSPRAGSLLDRVAKLKEADEIAEELYLGTLTRRPTDEEKREIGDYLKKRPEDRAAVLLDMAWALLASAEFRFNH